MHNTWLYTDYQLQLLFKELKPYVKDSSDYIRKIRNIENVPENCIPVTLDAPSLYTNNLNNEELKTVKKHWNEKHVHQSHNHTPSISNHFKLLSI